MFEQGKAATRRTADRDFVTRYIVGHGLDVGAGPDPITKYAHRYPYMLSARAWDLVDGDGQTLPGIAENSLDFVVASHVLEHLRLPRSAMHRWLQVLKPGGHLIIVVPDYEMYERNIWPSQFGVGHQQRFTSDRGGNYGEPANILELCLSLVVEATLERFALLRAGFDPNLPASVDQSLGTAECAIEIVLRKRLST